MAVAGGNSVEYPYPAMEKVAAVTLRNTKQVKVTYTVKGEQNEYLRTIVQLILTKGTSLLYK